MQIFESTSDAPKEDEWCLWLGTQSWSWARSGEPTAQQPWPEGEPPLEMPFELLAAALRLSDAGPASRPPSVRLMCSEWVDGAATDWWPDRRRAMSLWREWLASLGLSLIEVRRVVDMHATGQAGTSKQTWKTLWQARQPSFRLLPATAGWRLLVSILAATGLHMALAHVLRPAWEHHLAQNRWQAEQAERERLEQENQLRLHALNEEKTRQRQQWALEQTRGLNPWRELARFMGARQNGSEPQLWTGLRWAQGTWTVSGVTSHEPEPGLWSSNGADLGVVSNLNAAPITWPPEPARGWPAWRFQWQLETSQTSPPREAP